MTSDRQSTMAEYLDGHARNVRVRAMWSTAYGLGAQGATMAISLLTTAVLARLLTPGDFGTFAICMLYVSLMGVICDGGLPLATMQAKSLTHTQASNLFWIGLGISVVVAGVVAVASPLIAQLHHEEPLANLIAVAALTLIVASISSQQTAIMRRNLQFGRIALVNISSLAVSGVAGILAAKHNAGCWSLVLQLAVNQSVRAAVTWMLCPWRPCAPRKDSATLPLIRFGAIGTINEGVGYIERNLDQYALANMSDVTQLGVYTRSVMLLSLPTTQIAGIVSGVVSPALCRIHGDDARFERAYLDSVEVNSIFTLPSCVLMAVCSDEIVELVLGRQWSESADVIRALALGTAIRVALGNPIGWAHVASGRIARMLRWSLLVTPVSAAAFFASGRDGAVAIAWASSAVTALLAPLGLSYAIRGTTVSLRSFFRVVLMPAAFSIASGGIAFVVKQLVGEIDHAAISIAMDVWVFFAAYLLFWLSTSRARGKLIGMWTTFRRQR